MAHTTNAFMTPAYTVRCDIVKTLTDSEYHYSYTGVCSEEVRRKDVARHWNEVLPPEACSSFSAGWRGQKTAEDHEGPKPAAFFRPPLTRQLDIPYVEIYIYTHTHIYAYLSLHSYILCSYISTVKCCLRRNIADRLWWCNAGPPGRP
jgi:hypothetical protein